MMRGFRPEPRLFEGFLARNVKTVKKDLKSGLARARMELDAEFGPGVCSTPTEGNAMESQKKRVRAREFVKDLRGGMDDDALMTKYALSRDQFHKLLRMAVDAGLLNSDDLYSRISLSKTAVTKAFVEMQEAVRDLSTVTAVVDRGTE